MREEITIEKHALEFIIPAKTSRGEYAAKNSWLIQISANGFTGTGEASPLPDLSVEGQTDLQDVFNSLLKFDAASEEFSLNLKKFPSLQFAWESAILDLKNKKNGILFDTAFTRKENSIPINGLVWMAEIDQMLVEAEAKINAGFRCIKIKIGSHDHDAECRMLESIRKKYSAFQLEMRLDANGAFLYEDALVKLKDFSRFEVHSLEQPIKAGQLDRMQEICAKSPVDIALDEELIGIRDDNEKEILVKNIKPKYLILKPTLLGGFHACDHWISVAEKNKIGWWATSALEGNIGLSHIAQWVSTKKNPLHQGLGTGKLFKNNFNSRTQMQGEKLWFTD